MTQDAVPPARGPVRPSRPTVVTAALWLQGLTVLVLLLLLFLVFRQAVDLQGDIDRAVLAVLLGLPLVLMLTATVVVLLTLPSANRYFVPRFEHRPLPGVVVTPGQLWPPRGRSGGDAG